MLLDALDAFPESEILCKMGSVGHFGKVRFTEQDVNKLVEATRVGSTRDKYEKFLRTEYAARWKSSYLKLCYLLVPTYLLFVKGGDWISGAPEGFINFMNWDRAKAVESFGVLKWGIAAFYVVIFLACCSMNLRRSRRLAKEVISLESDSWVAQTPRGHKHLADNLTAREMEVAKVLLKDGFTGSIKDLITVAKGLS